MNEFLLNLLIFIPAFGGLACLIAPRASTAKAVALLTAILCLIINLVLLKAYFGHLAAANMHYSLQDGVLAFVTDVSWIPAVGIRYTIGVDGLSLPLILLTSVLNVLIIMASFSVKKNIKAFLALYLFLMMGMYGVFLALDFFLFYVFFEVSLLPMYFLIGIWGGPRKEYAAIKFFIYTLVGSVLLLIVMLGLYLLVPNITGRPASEHTVFNMIDLASSPDIHRAFGAGGMYWGYAKWFFILLFVAFAIKVPVVPFHTWLPDAHVEAPTPISMILAGVLLKMGGYALMRISYPIFPEAARWAWFFVALMGVISIIYGAFCAMAQTDWKKLVAYSSVSHMGYVLLGLGVLTVTGFNGAYFQMIGHGISSAMMFYLVGVVYERAHHRNLNRFGGIWNTLPAYTTWATIGFFAGLGLPLLCGFPGEALSLLGTFGASDWVANASAGIPFAGSRSVVYLLGAVAATGAILTAGYILWMFQRVYMGPAREEYTYTGDKAIKIREYAVMAPLGILALALGILPSLFVFSITNDTVRALFSILRPEALQQLTNASGH
ncbi:MAG TPA: NADH-quinone oxidoreductase subunit M [Phycisphaeraceae bacterium]|nr:NADH-quinone oxidoreductase subunit M [Phycisphaeraceae bacterium]